VAAEVGVPALVLFVTALWLSYRAMGRTAARAPEDAPLAHGVQTSLVGFSICSLTGAYAFSWPLYFILGLAAAIHAVDGEEARA
jgi:hypothetical protein